MAEFAHICVGTTPALQRTMIFHRVVSDDVNRAGRVVQNASGKPINVARVLTVLGEKAVVCLPVGGKTGEIVRDDLVGSGIAHRCVEVSSPTRTCVTVIDQTMHTATELVEESGPLTGEETGQIIQTLGGLLGSAKMLVLSGSLAPGVGPGFYAECCRAANPMGVGVILDARGVELKLALAAKPMVVKLNRAELAGTLDVEIEDESSLRSSMTELHRQGPAWVIVTLGADGALLHDGKSFWKISPIKIDAVSPIGSGDAFAAGLSSGIANGVNIPDACKLAAACGAANALVPGAGLLRMEDVRRLEKVVRLERV
jgi:tagatose 6-phosphate kinase